MAGIASGEPAAQSIVLWTRIALDALGRQPVKGRVPVMWELANDEALTRIVARGTETAIAAEGHSVHVEVPNLKPGREYFYRFHANGERAPGRAHPHRSAPRPVGGNLRFCVRLLPELRGTATTPPTGGWPRTTRA